MGEIVDLFKYQGKMRRRKRVVEGESVAEQARAELEQMQPLKDKGLFCKPCRKWHTWREMQFTYEKQSGTVCRVISGPCGSMLRTDAIMEVKKDG